MWPLSCKMLCLYFHSLSSLFLSNLRSTVCQLENKTVTHKWQLSFWKHWGTNFTRQYLREAPPLLTDRCRACTFSSTLTKLKGLNIIEHILRSFSDLEVLLISEVRVWSIADHVLAINSSDPWINHLVLLILIKVTLRSSR